jgi:effector-binding domain-containing protein
VLGQPEVVHRGDQPYVAIKALVTMETLGAVLPGLHPEVRGWITARGDVPSGAPFFKYNVIDMERALEVEVGFPVAHAMTGDERVQAGVLPGGEYAMLLFTGHPDGLIAATEALLQWAAQQGLEWDVAQASDGERWAARLEIYELDAPEDMDRWNTELAFRLADRSGP